MLAGDCVAAPVGAQPVAALESAADISAASGTDAIVSHSSANLVFVDARVDDIDQLVGGLAGDHELILLDSSRPGLEQISQLLERRTNVSSLHILGHGETGRLRLGNQTVDLQTLNRFQSTLRGWSGSLTADADILVYGCDTGADAEGLKFIERLAELTGADVAASTDKTGDSELGGDWDLERQVGVINAGLAWTETARASYRSVLPITINASGSTGAEQMLLQIDEVTVATYDNVGVDLQQYTYAADGINADQVRVVFTNDLYDPDNGIDRNLRVDSITIDGVTYETESSEVFSTGTWLPADGIVPGFRESETLHSDGYFQYAGTAIPPGDPSGLVINEIHYNPGPDGVVDGDAEFIELYNSGDEAVDLGGMSFSGFDLTFAPGTIIEAGQYAIVSPSIALAESTWGVTPIAEFAGGGISGSGELIQLIAADGVTVIDEVDYLDETPWSALPDGNGPSLELRDWALDNSLAENWGPSDGQPTPGVVNSIYGQAAPDPITDIGVVSGEVLPNEAFTISANIEGATTANLIYLVGFGEEQTVAMTNTDGSTWQATLPGADAGQLIRYRIESDVAIAPFNDTINYFGLVVTPSDIIGNELPVFQFFVDEAQFTELTTTELALTNTTIPAVVYYNGEVIDNATVRVRGGDFARTNFDKKSLKFELPKGYAIDIGSEGSYPIDEFAINADFGDWSVVAPDISWDIFNAESDTFASSFFVRAEINGDFHGVFRFQELYDGAWRDANGVIGDDELYKADGGGFGEFTNFDKKSPDDGDYTSINALNAVLNAPSSAAKTAYLYDNVDIANVVNHMALSVLMRHDDQEVQNFYMVRDAETSVWSIVQWDLDRLWIEAGDETEGAFTTPEPIEHELFSSIWEVPEFQDMYWRRMQTLTDTYLSEENRAAMVARFDELVEQIGPTNSSLEFARWNRNDIYSNPFWRNEYADALDTRFDAFAGETRLPGTASGQYDIVINELHYNPLDGDAEFIELYNASATESVDLSGWTIDGVNLTIGYGTVILPQQRIVFTDDLARFRAQAPGDIFIAGQYSGGLAGGGELITLLDASGTVIDQVDYQDSDPWPSEPDGNGYTLALIDPSLDNALASSWVASSQINGTPGKANDSQTELSTLKIFAAGSTGAEAFTVEVAGEQVAIFDLASFGGKAGDLSARNFIELTWLSETTIDPADVRINFINDVYDPDNGIDANLAIDRIEIDGVAYETEAPDVFSTGTYLSEDGIVPGFRESEILHINGYFQYASESPNSTPVAVDDVYTTLAGNLVSGNLLGNDSDADGDTLILLSHTDPGGGSLSVDANGNFVYTPTQGFSGSDSFGYVVADPSGATATGNVSITVEPVVLFADGNVIQLLNFQYDAYLAGSGSRAVTSTANNTAAQWQLVDAGNDSYLLRNLASGRYLDGDFGDVDTSSSSGSIGTQWRFIENGEGYHYLYNVFYRDYVDANGSNTVVDWDPGTLDPDDLWLVTLV
ncbi:Inner spore coat protein H [Stieleria varia]|uniref:Inner spore coat protein H n=2 Tax=Stieleria varia TaxID=2528005 RepID=A0A5C6ANR8_9BACT|nr:Inner spore coat protein H [Stieleria varia]